MIKTSIYLVFLILVSTAALSFSGNGSGTEEDPYQITNVYELQEMKDDLDAHYILMNDIDATETRDWNVGDHDNDPSTPDSAMGFEPVGKQKNNDFELKKCFRGTLNGYGFKISDLFINRPDQNFVGLLGSISNGAYIFNLYVSDIFVSGKSSVGGLVGEAYNYGSKDSTKLEKCITSGRIIGTKEKIGGFIGSIYNLRNVVKIYKCMSESDVIGSEKVGGILWRK
jgi:hypothetical protein